MKPRETKAIHLEGDLPGSAAGAIYTNVVNRLIEDHGGKGVLLVTSPNRGAGRTTTAANVGLALLQKKLSVLLMEITETTPTMERAFGESPSSRGLEDVLAGKQTLDAIVCKRTDHGLLFAMMKKSIGLDLESEPRAQRLAEMLSYAASRCDWTVIDGPSHEDSASLLALAKRVSKVLIVIGKRTTKRSQLVATLAELEPYLPYVLMTT